MNLIKSACSLFVTITLASVTLQAAPLNTGNEIANISIKQIVMSGTSGWVSCHNSLANCLVSLKYTNPTEGWVTILNNSGVVATNVKATLPPTWAGNVIPKSTCDVIKVGQSCTLNFIANVSTPLAKETIPVKGDNTTTVFFDMEVIA